MPTGKGPLRIALEDFLETFGLGDKVSQFFTKKVENIERSFFRLRKPTFDSIKDVPGLPPELKDFITGAMPGSAQTGVVELLGWAAGVGQQAASGFMAPVSRMLNYFTDAILHSARFDPATATRVAWRRPETENRDIGALITLGWDKERIDSIVEVMRPLVDEFNLVTLWRRGVLPDTGLVSELHKRGWTDERIEQLKKVSELIPNVGDLIAMAVREAWNDEVSERFEYDADFPAEVGEWTAKQGMAPEWAKRYWRAHWQIPSVMQGFEMFQRLRPGRSTVQFTEADLQSLMQTADIPKFFRERLTKVAYLPFTRVDIRRMYSAGVIDETEVLESYKDIGYDDEHAQRLTDWTTQDTKTEDRGLTADVFLGAYKRGVFTRDEALTNLQDIGYSAEDAEIKLSLADYDIQQALLKDETARVKQLYVAGEYTAEDVYAQLGKFNLPAEQVQALLLSWDIAARSKVKLPSENELEDFYERNIITRDELLEGMKKLGFVDKYTPWYLARLDTRIADAAAKAAADAQSEQERIAKAEASSIYQRTVADFDVEIALDKLEIANIKVSMNELEDEAQIAAAQEIIKQDTLDIIGLNLQKAQARKTFVEAVTPPPVS